MALVVPCRNISYKIFKNWKIILERNLDSLISKNNNQQFSLMKENTGSISSSIEEKLKVSLNPSHLEIINESYQHNVPLRSETHFKVVVVSSRFTEMPLIKRHRLVNEILSSELKSGVHALSIIAKTPSQWESSDQVIEKSPACRGGFGK